MSIQQDKFTDIANAIRGKKGTTEPIIANDFAEEIRSIGGGDDVWIIPKPDESVVGNYYIALAYGTLGKDEASSDITIVYGNATTRTELSGTGNPRVINCFTDIALTISVQILNVQLVGLWFGSNFIDTSIANSFLSACISFNQPIVIPDTVTIIGNSFLSNCTSFNQLITIPDSVTSIGTNFLSPCVAFNQPIEIPSTVISIGNGFLSNSTAFNKPIIIPNGITSIGTTFLSACISFNKPITIPNGIESIGNSFLSSCNSFNQSITIPTGVTSIGNSFLYQCHSMTSEITYEAGVYPTDNSSLSTTSSAAFMYTRGIPIGGTNAAGLIAALPNRTTSPYRNLRLAE